MAHPDLVHPTAAWANPAILRACTTDLGDCEAEWEVDLPKPKVNPVKPEGTPGDPVRSDPRGSSSERLSEADNLMAVAGAGAAGTTWTCSIQAWAHPRGQAVVVVVEKPGSVLSVCLCAGSTSGESAMTY